jgi:DHA1 family bicyclomycin/chloramphenicol resistance-like MFS transporter
MAVMAMAFTVAPAAGPILGGYLQAAFDWHAVFVALSALGAVLLIVTLVTLPETNRAPDPMATRPGRVAGTYAGLARHPAFLAHVVPATALVAGMLTMHATLPFLLIDRLDHSPTQYGWLTLITVGAFFMGSLTTGRFGRRLGTERSLRIALAVVALSAGLYVASALFLPLSALGVLGPMVVWVYAMGFSMPACMAGAMAPFPRSAGSASALMGFLQMGGGAVASIVVAKLQDGTLLPAALVMAGLATVAVVGYRRYAPRAVSMSGLPAVGGD